MTRATTFGALALGLALTLVAGCQGSRGRLHIGSGFGVAGISAAPAALAIGVGAPAPVAQTAARDVSVGLNVDCAPREGRVLAPRVGAAQGAAALDAVAGASVTMAGISAVTDAAGRYRLGALANPAPRDADPYRLHADRAGSNYTYITARFEREGTLYSLIAIVTLDCQDLHGDGSGRAARVSPGTTVLARLLQAEATRTGQPLDALGGGGLPGLAAMLDERLPAVAASAVLTGGPEAARGALDAVLAADPAFAGQVAAALGGPGAAAVLGVPAGPAAVPSAPPSPRHGGHNAGLRHANGAAVAFATAGHFTLVRAAGDEAGGNAAGTSPFTAALRAVAGVAVAADGTLYLADPENHQIRRVVPGGAAERLAGAADGTAGFFDHVLGTASRLDTPLGLIYDAAADSLLVADAGNGRVRLLRPDGRIDTFAGGGSVSASPTTALALQLDEPVALVADTAGRVYVADRAAGQVWRLAADGVATMVAAVPGASSLALDPGRDLLWIGTATGDIRCLTAAGTAPALAAEVLTPDAGAPAVNGLATDQRGSLYALLEAAGGDGARVWRVPYNAAGGLAAGRTAEVIAGAGTAGADAAAYSAPIVALADARTGRLNGRFPGSLAIDLNAANDPLVLAGQLYAGASYDREITRGQVVRLDPAE